MDLVLIIGRILFALIFINSGIAHFTKTAAMTGYAQYKKVPAAKVSVLLSGAVILIGGVLIVLGVYADLGALLIALFSIISAFMMHNFWTIEDATAKQGETASFFKNLALGGAALILFVLIGQGASIGASLGSPFFNL
jgi:uncharacterized membrane protein YphA (DoxX/SURF4 family)